MPFPTYPTNQTITTTDGLNINPTNQIIIKNLNINSTLNNNNSQLTLINSKLNKTLNHHNNTLTLQNTTTTDVINNYAELKIQNIFNSTINNQGTLIIDDNTLIGEKYQINGNGKIYTNATQTLTGNQKIENKKINIGINIPTTGNITLTNCQINAEITNNGNLTLTNCNISTYLLTNNGKLHLNNCNLSFNLNGIGDIYINNCNSIYCPINTQGNTIINNTEGTLSILQNANLTIQNSNLNATGGVNSINNTYIINSTISKNGNSFRSTYLIIEQSTLKDNYAVMLANKIQINNSLFSNNSYSGGSWGLLSSQTIYIENTTFKNNAMRNAPGLIFFYDMHNNETHYYGNIKNCTFEDNYMLTNGAWTKYGGVCIYIYPSFDTLYHNDGTFIITNNIFKNNSCNATEGQIAGGSTYFYDLHTNGWGTDINIETINDIGSGGLGYSTNITLSIENNTFTNSQTTQKAASILVNIRNDSENNNIQIINNQFTNTQSISETIILNNTGNVLMKNNKYTNSTIDFNNLIIENPGKLYAGDTVTLKVNIELSHPEYYDQDLLEQTRYNWYIDGENITTNIPEYTLTVTNDSMIIYVTPSITNTRSQLLVLSPTVLGDKIITPENIEEYLFEGQLVKISENTKVIFQGNFTNKEEIAIKTNNLLLDGSNATFTNTSFLIESNDTTIQNMNINNKDTSNYIITNTGNNNIIRNNKLTTYNKEGLTAAIKDLNSKNTIITQNTITVTGPARDITGSNGARAANTQAILSNNALQSTITYNNITVTNSTDPELAQFSTIEAITAPQGTKNTISYNNIQCTGARFNYGISLLTNIKENTISHNNITVTGYRYTDGIQIGDGAINNTVSNNQIKLTCLNTTPVDEAAISYGIYLTNQGETPSENNTIIENNIKINGMVNYGMEIYTATNTQITDNQITLIGAKSMGIGYAHSPNSTITRNTIKTIDDSSIPINSITEELQPLNTGIRIQQDSDNILIEDNTIQTYDKQGKDTCINIDSSNVTIKDNNLTSSTKTGDNTIKTTQPDTTPIEDNTAIEQNSTTQTATEDLTIGDSTTLTAQFYDDTFTPVSGGKAIFRVNGKTLRDDQGNVIYADVINGRAELPNVNITQEWTKTDTTIQAVYIGDDNNEPITTTPTTINVTKPEATITLEAPTTATAGETITLKATVTDGDNTISSGRVAFKLNGKTLKDPKTGKALYAEVKDRIATITYTIPEKTKVKEYTLTALFTDTRYDRVEAESKLNVVKA